MMQTIFEKLQLTNRVPILNIESPRIYPCLYQDWETPYILVLVSVCNARLNEPLIYFI